VIVLLAAALAQAAESLGVALGQAVAFELEGPGPLRVHVRGEAVEVGQMTAPNRLYVRGLAEGRARLLVHDGERLHRVRVTVGPRATTVDQTQGDWLDIEVGRCVLIETPQLPTFVAIGDPTVSRAQRIGHMIVVPADRIAVTDLFIEQGDGPPLVYAVTVHEAPPDDGRVADDVLRIDLHAPVALDVPAGHDLPWTSDERVLGVEMVGDRVVVTPRAEGSTDVVVVPSDRGSAPRIWEVFVTAPRTPDGTADHRVGVGQLVDVPVPEGARVFADPAILEVQSVSPGLVVVRGVAPGVATVLAVPGDAAPPQSWEIEVR
jgi:hypothetical protein